MGLHVYGNNDGDSRFSGFLWPNNEKSVEVQKNKSLKRPPLANNIWTKETYGESCSGPYNTYHYEIGKDGVWIKELADFESDGIVDRVTTREKDGNIVKVSIDNDVDGKPDRIVTTEYKEGVLTEYYDDDADGKVDYTETYETYDVKDLSKDK